MLSGHFSGTLTENNHTFREFMSEWEVAHFLMMSHEELERLIESGELNGIFTVFQVERTVMRRDSEEWIIERSGNPSAIARPIPIEYETIMVDQRIFSRERLINWLHLRMDG